MEVKLEVDYDRAALLSGTTRRGSDILDFMIGKGMIIKGNAAHWKGLKISTIGYWVII